MGPQSMTRHMRANGQMLQACTFRETNYISSPNALLGRNERAAGERVSTRVAHSVRSNIMHFEGFSALQGSPGGIVAAMAAMV